MDKWSFRNRITRDLMMLAVALEGLTLYPHQPVIVLVGLALATGSILSLFSSVTAIE